MTQFSPAFQLGQATAEPKMQFPSVFTVQSTPSDTAVIIEDSDDDEFHDALTSQSQDPEPPTTEELPDLKSCSVNYNAREAFIYGFWEDSDDDMEDSDEEDYDDEEDHQSHPLSGLHSTHLANSDWINHSFVDKTDHLDIWARHTSTDSSLPRCTWCAYPESSWSSPPNAPEDDWRDEPAKDEVQVPELKLTTPDGRVYWLDDPMDYEALPWEKRVAEERERILGSRGI